MLHVSTPHTLGEGMLHVSTPHTLGEGMLHVSTPHTLGEGMLHVSTPHTLGNNQEDYVYYFEHSLSGSKFKLRVSTLHWSHKPFGKLIT